MQLDYQIVYSQRKTITITVERDRSVVVRAPIGVAEEKIHEVVESKKLWLYEKINHVQKYPSHSLRKEFVTGETIMYLGRYYRLEITDDDEPGMRFQNRFYISRCQRANAAQMLREWYIERAREKVTPKIHYFAESLGVTYNQILISDLKYRWASCTPKNNLNFNWRIIKAPVFVIDYLIVHELAHLLEPNHTPRFWNIIAVQAPRYELAKEWLREHGNLLEEDF
jgi:predicted metal-dependent hydrolase